VNQHVLCAKVIVHVYIIIAVRPPEMEDRLVENRLYRW